MALTKIRFSTDAYEISHGRKPRGGGQWAFTIVDGRDDLDTVFAPGPMSLVDAKAWARDYCRQSYADRAALVIQVAP